MEAIPEEPPKGAKPANGTLENGVMQIEGLVSTHRAAVGEFKKIRVGEKISFSIVVGIVD